MDVKDPSNRCKKFKIDKIEFNIYNKNIINNGI